MADFYRKTTVVDSDGYEFTFAHPNYEQDNMPVGIYFSMDGNNFFLPENTWNAIVSDGYAMLTSAKLALEGVNEPTPEPATTTRKKTVRRAVKK